MGKPDFAGQSPDSQTAAPTEVPVRKVNAPGEDHSKPTRVFRSDDDLLHLATKRGLKAP